MNRELIKKEYEENQAKVISLFKWLKKSNNLDGEVKQSFFVKDFMPYVYETNDTKAIYSLADLYSFPNLLSREMPRKIHLFLGKDTINKYTKVSYGIYGIAPSFKYVVIYTEAYQSISYFSWFWLYDYVGEPFNPMQTIDRRKYGLNKVGKLYSFDESMEIIEALKDEWILSRI